MPSRLEARLQRLEQQRQGTATALAQGLSGLLASTQHSEAVPLAALTDAELDAKMTALAGARGLSLLLKEALEEECTRRQGAQGKESPACTEPSPTGGPGEHNRLKPAMPLGFPRVNATLCTPDYIA